MRIRLNGKETTTASGTTIGDMVRGATLNPDSVVVELNGKFIETERWNGLALAENDTIEIVTFLGGGQGTVHGR